MADTYPFSRPLYVMLKPVGDSCNMACSYCYYANKKQLYPEGERAIMSDDMLELFIRQYIQLQTSREILFTWHGGEPLLLPLSFYQRAVDLQQRYGKGHIIDNCIQTNGTMITPEWCKFFKDNDWLVGISIDGDACSHDAYRCYRNGDNTHADVMLAIDLLNQYDVEWNAMAVVNHINVQNPLAFYHFFKDIGCRYLQFTPVVERYADYNGIDARKIASGDEQICGAVTPQSVTPDEWGFFLCTIFDEWVRHDVGNIFVQLFDAALSNWVGVTPGLCSISKWCGHAAVMEYNGDVYSCDHYVFKPFLLGNIREHTLVELLYSDRQQEFGARKTQMLPLQCKSCSYLFACNGECPKNRISICDNEDKHLNYLCKGYYRFFSHVTPYMNFMHDELSAGRAPANIMQILSK